MVGCSSQAPPTWRSSRRAKRKGASKCGAHSQLMAPRLLTKAAVRQLPMRPWSAMLGGGPARSVVFMGDLRPCGAHAAQVGQHELLVGEAEAGQAGPGAHAYGPGRGREGG